MPLCKQTLSVECGRNQCATAERLQLNLSRPRHCRDLAPRDHRSTWALAVLASASSSIQLRPTTRRLALARLSNEPRSKQRTKARNLRDLLDRALCPKGERGRYSLSAPHSLQQRRNSRIGSKAAQRSANKFSVCS
jgi:hypothetical protein